MRVLVIGANGNTATRVVSRLAEGPHDPVAMIRRGLTSRENLAAVLVRCLDLHNTVGKTFSLLDGETPLEDALQAL